MKMMSHALCLAAFSAALAGAVPAAAVEYTVLDLGPPPGSENYYTSYAAGLNDSGQVVGYLQNPKMSGIGAYQAFVTGPGGKGFTLLGSLGGDWSQAIDINNAGQIAGNAGAADGSSRAFITVPGGPLTDLGTLGGTSSSASAINASGQVVGRVRNRAGYDRAFITDTGGRNLRELGTRPGFHSSASGINDRGQVVGETESVAYPSGPNAEIWTPEAFVTGPGGAPLRPIKVCCIPPGGDVSPIRGDLINDRGDVAGTIGYYSRPYLAPAGAEGIPLDTDPLRHIPPPTPTWVVRTFVRALGDHGEIGGQFSYGTNIGAFISGPGGTGLMNLNDLEFSNPEDAPDNFWDVTGINSAGQILANGSDQRAYLLTPIPEPDILTLLLAGLGLSSAAGLRRRARGPARHSEYRTRPGTPLARLSVASNRSIVSF
jgi:probable HAF family extracellular repeat protein